ncbi:polysaccharide biosynthesis/export family protein [Sphingobacterium sp. UBA7038]|uniref:polysaccharide biosynthesis/export family protein n=1 Tax=Sphingobacterium sp. UBA7038 TaxID=1947515 RepID=UPI00257EB2B3|nr:polysaccharide biosynthesis/export family protein [Sphingobacterium sp. UBA7038]
MHTYFKFKHYFQILLLTSIILGLTSCGSRKSIIYLQSDSTNIVNDYEKYIPRIQPNDILSIAVSAADLKAAMPFNQVSPYQMNSATSTDLAMKPTYTVDQMGMIDFPVIGKIRLEGLTRMEAMDKLRGELKKYIVDPGVNMSFNNFKVTVIGEVARPGSFPLQNERITLLEALGMAGDMTMKGVRNNVLVIREVNGQKTVNRVDLSKQGALNSPFYYLAQNDVVYVEPNKSQIRNANYGQNTNVLISVVGLIITVISVIVR